MTSADVNKLKLASGRKRAVSLPPPMLLDDVGTSNTKKPDIHRSSAMLLSPTTTRNQIPTHRHSTTHSKSDNDFIK
jgi:hypothetical protein